MRVALVLAGASSMGPMGRASEADYLRLILPGVGDHTLHILSPTLLELKRLNTKPPAPAPVDSWDFVDEDFVFHPPALSEFEVKVDGVTVEVVAVGFKRRPFYAPLVERDLRIDNSLYLTLAAPVPAGAAVEVTNPSGALWDETDSYAATADPLRYSPAIHVNQEGYLPDQPKKAMVGYYLGNLGEMDVPASLGFTLINAATGVEVFAGSLELRPDVGYLLLPAPYQKVLEADFSAFETPGRYQLVVPGLGASLPFAIDQGVAMGFLRTYALGLYHQRCGATNELPFTRFVHDACHLAPAAVPLDAEDFAFTWMTIASKNVDYADNPRHTAPRLQSPETQLYPFVNPGPVDVSGGHHDAGDYSKYTINSAALTHLLTFTVDAIPGAGAFDNLGLPESGDGVSDLLQELKREADFLAKMQDADGGFYFLVYPQTREYENNVLPDEGDAQVVWPKNTAATAAAVAALAQVASSPAFKAEYPEAAALYLAKAALGWQFLTDAIAAHGKDGAYQKITFYGDPFMHDDELAWAACEMFLATGEAQYHEKLVEWFPDPSDTATFQWGWWRLSHAWGNAIRSYAFAARTGRLPLAGLDAAYLEKCEAQIVAAGDDTLRWSNQNAYATSFPEETKRFQTGGWYFSLNQAADIAAAYQLEADPDYLEALVGNLNFEAGCNPVNVTYVTGLGAKRQREIVHQYAQNDRRVLPPSGVPLGNIQTTFSFLPPYGAELAALVFPSDGADTSPYEFYDRWADSFNLTQEFIAANQARALVSLCVLATLTPSHTAPWESGTADITVPGVVVALGEPVTLSVAAPGFDLTDARIVWEARDQEPTFGPSYTIAPLNNGPQWVEAEIALPDGRRIFGTGSFQANSPVVRWIDGKIPRGGAPEADGGDAWTWATGPVTPSGKPTHASSIATAIHYHGFRQARATLDVSVGDTLFAWVYLDPENPPAEVMLTWNDGSPEHRAFWGENLIHWGTNGTAGRYLAGPLPPTGEWVRLEVPASAVGLEGSTVTSMDFVLHGGRAYWDTAGLMAPGVGAPIITAHPEPVTVHAGMSASLSVVASGSPPPTYQWRRNGIAIPGATEATLTLGAAQVADAGAYSVVLTNSVQSVTSLTALLTVIPPVTVTVQPASRTIVAGGNVTFDVTATGTLPLTYQWRKNGTPIEGATEPAYTIAAVAVTDAGNYDVVVNDAVGTTTSAAAVLTVHYGPEITLQPVAVVTNAGETAFFSVTAVGNPALTYQWRKEGVAIEGNVSATAATLALGNVTPVDAGNYDVVVTNAIGSTISNAVTLTVRTPPAIVEQPVSRAVALGAAATFSVTATGLPAPTYQWRRNGVAMTANPTATTATLLVPAAAAEDAASYDVVITNAAGSVTSSSVSLTLSTAPSITAQPQALAVRSGTTATFSVTATGLPGLSYQWRKDGVAIAGETSATLTLSNVQPENAGNYSVVIGSLGGSVTSENAALAVITGQHSATDGGYLPGGTVTITNTITYAGPLAGLRWQVLLPEGWRYQASEGAGEVTPEAGATDVLEWSWTTLPVGAATFSYTLEIPVDATGEHALAALVSSSIGSAEFTVLVQPDPLTLARAPWHTADLSRDGRIGLTELLRVIELYNTRNGTVRTGAYRVDEANVEDGFASDPERASSVTVELTRYHDADTNRDGKLGLTELLRVCELYNYREGTVRTGEYHLATSATEDGFAAGP